MHDEKNSRHDCDSVTEKINIAEFTSVVGVNLTQQTEAFRKFIHVGVATNSANVHSVQKKFWFLQLQSISLFCSV